jgi:RNA polymerase sigma-70 factor (ECF subfamily)
VSNPTDQAVDDVVRTSYGRLVALLAAQTRDIATAEDALSDALPPRCVRGRNAACRMRRKHGC